MRYQGIWIYQSKNKALCCLRSHSHEALAPIGQHNIRKMSKASFLDFQYNLSKRKFLRKPTRMFSFGDRQNSSLLPGYMPNPDELKWVFDKFDSNKDGKISPDEYKAILRVLGKENMIKEVPKIFEVVDLDGDGFIDFSEFVELHKREGGVKTTEIQCAFRTFDLDGDGKISAEEVFELLKRLGEKCSLQDCRRMVRAVDANGDGVIDMDEFITMMTRTMKLYRYKGIRIYQSKSKVRCSLRSLSCEAVAPIVQHTKWKMSKVGFLEFKYNLSKTKFLRKPTQMFSSRDREFSSLLPAYMPIMDEMKQVFDQIDSDKDGKISQEDYKDLLRAIRKENEIKLVPKIFKAVDLDGDGFINFKDFVKLHNRAGGVKTTDIHCAFRTIDSDENGKIGAKEVFELLKRLGENCSLEDCQKMVTAVDADGDGVIDMDDFMTMMTGTMKPSFIHSDGLVIYQSYKSLSPSSFCFKT
ncbi:unnamed protein product [Camellia sinensis]